jgi:hypothetical protein
MRQSAELAQSLDHCFALGSRYMLGVLEGGDRGRALREEARATIEAEGWKNWRRGVLLCAPGNLKLLGD